MDETICMKQVPLYIYRIIYINVWNILYGPLMIYPLQ